MRLVEGSHLQQIPYQWLMTCLGLRAPDPGVHQTGLPACTSGAERQAGTHRKCTAANRAHLISKLLLLSHEGTASLLPCWPAQLRCCGLSEALLGLLLRSPARGAAFPLAEAELPGSLLVLALGESLSLHVQEAVGGVPQHAHDVLVCILGSLRLAAVAAGGCPVRLAERVQNRGI